MTIAEIFDSPTGWTTAPASSPDWMTFATCKGRTFLFYPHPAERPEARARREAKADRLCRSCPVAAPCREYARTNREYGFWAGESEEDRHLAGFTVSAPIGVRPDRRRISG